MHPEGRRFLAIRVVASAVNQMHGIALGDRRSDCPEIAPEIATSAHWILLADLRNGVRLYRTGVKE